MSMETAPTQHATVRLLIQKFAEISKIFDSLQGCQRDLFLKGMEKYLCVTNDEVFWMRLEALATGATAILGGAAGGASAFIPAAGTGKIFGQFDPAFMKSALKIITKVAPQIGNTGQSLLHGETTKKNATRTLLNSVTIPGAQQFTAEMRKTQQTLAENISTLQRTAKASA